MKRKQAASLLIDPKWETEVWARIELQYGITVPPHYRILRSGRKKLRLLSEKAFELFSQLPYTVTAGLYLGEYSRNAVRLSMDGAQILGQFATRNVVTLNKYQAANWLQGESINYKDERRGYVIVKEKDKILGCGRLSNGVLHSFVPKVRRPKTP